MKDIAPHIKEALKTIQEFPIPSRINPKFTEYIVRLLLTSPTLSSCRFSSSKSLQLLSQFFFQIFPWLVHHLHIHILVQMSASQRDLVWLLYLKLSNLSPSSHLPITLHFIIMDFFIAKIIIWIYLNNLLSDFTILFLHILECKHFESRKHDFSFNSITWMLQKVSGT